MFYTTLQKTTLSLFLLLGLSTNALAISPDTNPANITTPTTVTPFQTTNSPSKVIEFARQAAAIAGVAQACSQNVTDFSAHIKEAINKLTNNPSEQAAAFLIYQQIAQEAQMAEKKNQTIPCTKVIQDFLSLPIMQPDYKTTVIDKLEPSGP